MMAPSTVHCNDPVRTKHHAQRRHPCNFHNDRRIGTTCLMGFVIFLSLTFLRNNNDDAMVMAFCIAPSTTTGTCSSIPSRTNALFRPKRIGTNTHSEDMTESPPYGNMHGTNSCFLPLQQLEQDTYMPRIISIVSGIYPSNDITLESIQMTPKSEYAPALGQWTYTFHTPTVNANADDIPVQASIALEGSNIVASCEDPIIVIAEHTALNILLPAAITEPVDLLVLIDRSKTYFSERKFLLLAVNEPEQQQQQQQIQIAAFHTRDEIPSNAIVLGHVEQVTIPWLPAMAPTKTGFLEADEYY
jgi:hypothetical protein